MILLLTIIQQIPLTGEHVRIHVYQLSAEGASQEELEDEDLPAAQHWVLPATEYHGLWDTLIFDSHIKAEVQVFNYFSAIEVDSHKTFMTFSKNRDTKLLPKVFIEGH